jgi:hypothetical protein
MVAGFGVGVWIHEDNRNDVTVVQNSRHEMTEISYHGQNGVTAFRLLKERARVGYTTSSAGVTVTSINGIYPDGQMHWSLYINNMPSNINPSQLHTRSTEIISWKVQ